MLTCKIYLASRNLHFQSDRRPGTLSRILAKTSESDIHIGRMIENRGLSSLSLSLILLTNCCISIMRVMEMGFISAHTL